MGVANKIGIEPKELDLIMDVNEEIQEEDLDEAIEDVLDEDDFDEIEFEEEDDEVSGFGEFDSTDDMAGDFLPEASWEDIFAKTSKPKSGDFERLEDLLIMPGIEYLLSLVDPTELPYKHEGIGQNDEAYTSRAFDVRLIDLSPVRKFKEKYEKGDNRGNLCFVKEKKYKLWLSEVAFEWFAQFWSELGRKSPDDRTWTYEKVKKVKVTKHIFGEA